MTNEAPPREGAAPRGTLHLSSSLVESVLAGATLDLADEEVAEARRWGNAMYAAGEKWWAARHGQPNRLHQQGRKQGGAR